MGEEYDNGSSFGRWVLRITRRQALRAMRQKKEVATLEQVDIAGGEPDDPVGEGPNPPHLKFARIRVAMRLFKGSVL